MTENPLIDEPSHPVERLQLRVREPASEPEGALLLLHGRGADGDDLVPLLHALDPQARLLGITPQAPFSLPPGGWHWYGVPRVGYPDPPTFRASLSTLRELIETLVREREIAPERIVVGGFSQGAVMALATALTPAHKRLGGVVAFSGFVPKVEDFTPDPEHAAALPVALAHGTFDPVIPVEFGRDARDQLLALGCDLTYREAPVEHTLDPQTVQEFSGWLGERFRH